MMASLARLDSTATAMNPKMLTQQHGLTALQTCRWLLCNAQIEPRQIGIAIMSRRHRIACPNHVEPTWCSLADNAGWATVSCLRSPPTCRQCNPVAPTAHNVIRRLIIQPCNALWLLHRPCSPTLSFAVGLHARTQMHEHNTCLAPSANDTNAITASPCMATKP